MRAFHSNQLPYMAYGVVVLTDTEKKNTILGILRTRAQAGLKIHMFNAALSLLVC